MSISGKTTLTATHEGVTATRRSPRPYTHVVFGLYTPDLMIAHYRAQIAAPSSTPEWVARCTSIIAELEARGSYWQAVSWHQGLVNAEKGLRAARTYPTFSDFALVEVN